jgi:hypothetical protein
MLAARGPSGEQAKALLVLREKVSVLAASIYILPLSLSLSLSLTHTHTHTHHIYIYICYIGAQRKGVGP